MAIGLGLMLGFVFPKNFDSPYRSGSITEFWHRWHISLSTWLRDYLYVPLGGNRKGPAHLREPVHRDAARRALARRGVDLRDLGRAARRAARLRAAARQVRALRRLPAPLRTALTFVIVLVTWVFFRAPDLPLAMRVSRPTCSAIGGPQDGSRPARRHRLPAVLPGDVRAGGGDRVGRAADVGLDAHADPPGRRRSRSACSRSRRWCWPRRPSTRSSISSSDVRNPTSRCRPPRRPARRWPASRWGTPRVAGARTARCWCFLVAIAIVPLVEWMRWRGGRRGAPSAWSHLSQLPARQRALSAPRAGGVGRGLAADRAGQPPVLPA
jgi:hypothetical protein